MKTWLRLAAVWGAVLAAATAYGSEITIAGQSGHSLATPARSAVSEQPTIPYWQYKSQQAQSPSSSGRISRSVRSGIRYASGLEDWKGVGRQTFRYWNYEYSKIRFDRLQPLTPRGKLGGSSWKYTPGIRYTTSFPSTNRTRYGSTIRYGFR